MPRLVETFGIKIIDASDKMVLAIEAAATQPSNRTLVTDTRCLSGDVRRHFLPSGNQPDLCYGLLLGRNKQTPGVHLMPMMPMEALCESRQPSERMDAVEKDVTVAHEVVWKRKRIPQQWSAGTQKFRPSVV